MNATHISTPSTRKYAQLPRGFRWFSEHCVLRQLDDSDITRIWKAVMHPAFAQCWTTHVPQSHADVSEFVRAAQADWQRGTRYTMAVVRKLTHDFVGWIELRTAGTERGAWTLDWFIHPKFVAADVTRDVLAAVADLMFSALDTRRLYANCAPRHALFGHLLNEAGFIELVPAGSLDHHTAQPRRQSLFHLDRVDWLAMRRTVGYVDGDPAECASWITTSLRHELTLI
jgi:RimJ/RimL family protein N-acetyltransferase